jgi:hypothetical protein
VQPTDTQKEMLATKQQVQADIKAAQDLVELYIQSNPNYSRKEEKKEEEPKPVELKEEKPQTQDQATGSEEQARKQMNRGKKHAFDMLARFMWVRANQPKDIPAAMVKCIDSLSKNLDDLNTYKYSEDFDRKDWENTVQRFSKRFTKLSKPKAPRLICEDGVSFGEFNAWVNEEFEKIPYKPEQEQSEQKEEKPKRERKQKKDKQQEEPKADAPADQTPKDDAKPKDEPIATDLEEQKDENPNNRGGRRQRGEYRGRGNGEGRGGRYRNNRGRQEDDDGFTLQTDEKPNRERRGGRGGRGRGDGEGRGRGEFRGRGNGEGRGGRPKDEATQPAQAQQAKPDQAQE